MWCKNCNIETNDEKCPICGETTVEDIPAEQFFECFLRTTYVVS